jgi:hypothetical protein
MTAKRWLPATDTQVWKKWMDSRYQLAVMAPEVFAV